MELDYALSSVSAEYESIYGKISIDLNIAREGGSLDLAVPAGSEAHIVLPGVDMNVGSGNYSFDFDM